MGEYIDEAFDRLRIELNELTANTELYVRFGIAGQTLDNFRDDLNIAIPNPLISESDLCIALIHQLRNCFAHAIVNPVWSVGERYRREYVFDDIAISLEGVDRQPFYFDHIGGPESLFGIRTAFERNLPAN